VATRIPTGLTHAEGRKFAFTLASAFAAITAIAWFRDRGAVVIVALALAGVMFAAGVLVPGRLSRVHALWMGMAHLISRFTTPIFLGLVFFILISPMGLVMRLFGRRPLSNKAVENSYWKASPSGGRSRLTTPY